MSEGLRVSEYKSIWSKICMYTEIVYPKFLLKTFRPQILLVLPFRCSDNLWWERTCPISLAIQMCTVYYHDILIKTLFTTGSFQTGFLIQLWIDDFDKYKFSNSMRIKTSKIYFRSLPSPMSGTSVQNSKLASVDKTIPCLQKLTTWSWR